MSGGGRGINMQSTREVIALVSNLEAQGARVEWGGGGKTGTAVGAFPAKVFPPDPTKSMILFHGSVSDRNAATLKRTEVRRAGLKWPFEKLHEKKKHSRKETPMTITAPPAPDTRAPGEHLVVPPGARNRTEAPLQSALDNFLPVADGMHQPFWTDQLTDALKALGITGFQAKAGGASVQRTQNLLDWAGFRVVEARKNRGGYSYRWIRDEAAERRPGVLRLGSKPVTPALDPKAEPKPAPAGFQVFEKPKPGGHKHERVHCETCGRTFTPDGYERHIEATQHGENKPLLQALATVSLLNEAQASVALDGETFSLEGGASTGYGPGGPEGTNEQPDTPQVEEPVDGGEVATNPEYERGLEEGMHVVDLELETLQAHVAKLVSEGAEQQARWKRSDEERVATITSLREQLAIQDGQRQQAVLTAENSAREEERAKLQMDLQDARAERETAVRNRATIYTQLEAAELVISEQKQELARFGADRDTAIEEALRATQRDGWRVDTEPLGLSLLQKILDDAERLGVTVELWARRA